MKPGTALRLGRVSNLPTVWTNALAGTVLAGAGGFGAEFVLVLLAFSLFYTGGMFLNDAFDAPFDAVHRPERPIPRGEVSLRAVFGWGFGLMALGITVLAWFGVAPALAGLTLAVAITFYDWH
ncbi:MAG: UbiA family prenyltransferase, partial [Burkholderiales bacterium]